MSLIRDGETDHSNVAFGESPFFGQRRFVVRGTHRMLHTKRDDKIGMYEYHQDPLEQNDIADQNPGEVDTMRELLEMWEELVRDSDPGDATRRKSIDEEILEQLQKQFRTCQQTMMLL